MMKFSANISILFTEVPFMQRFERAARAGFKAVEFWFPYEWPASEIRAELERNALTLIGLNAPPGNVAGGDWGIAVHAARQVEFRDSVALALDYANALSCGNVHVMAGVPLPNVSPAETEAVYRDNIGFAADKAAALNNIVLIEPLNPIDRPGYWLSTQAHARRVVEGVARPNVKIMFDVYHVQMTEGRIASNLQASLPHIGHIQIADVPGRGEPGTGEINFPFVFDAIECSGYTGWVGCEYKPVKDSLAGLGWMRLADAG
jgi:2-dehydrotetronate isomerase